ncbi:MAG: hypothetical protein ACRD1X_16350 [Vicinamibacteria bacterium]
MGQLLIAVAVAVAWLAVALLPLPGVVGADRAPGLDAHVYVAMAEAPTVFTMPPYAYRLGVPWLAHVLPFSLETNFFLLTCLGLLATLVLGYVLFRELGYSHGLAILGLSFVAAAPEVSVYLGNHFLVDPLALALILAVFVAIEKRVSAGPIALLLLIASLFKETAFFVVPVLYLRFAGARLVDHGAAWRTLVIATPAVIAALTLRFAWGGGFDAFPYLSPWEGQRQPWYGSLEAYEAIWSGLFGYLAVLAVVNAFSERWQHFVRCYLPYAVLVVAQLLVPQNSERVLFFAFPVVIPLALVEFQRIRDELPDWFPFLTTLLVVCYVFLPDQLAPPMVLVILARILIERGRPARAAA